MKDATGKQIADAYRRMAAEAYYRPAAPSDGFGNITVPVAKLDLDVEAARYARTWWEAEDAMCHWVGCCDWRTRPATIFAIEAVRLMASGPDGNVPAFELLQMAAQDLLAVMAQEAAAP